MDFWVGELLCAVPVFRYHCKMILAHGYVFEFLKLNLKLSFTYLHDHFTTLFYAAVAERILC